MTKDTDTNTPREGSKAAAPLEMLQRKDGATLDEMTERAGRQSRMATAAIKRLST